VHPAWLELHRRDRRGRAAHEGERLPGVDAGPVDRTLNLCRDVDDVGIPLGREARLGNEQLHPAKLPNGRRPSQKEGPAFAGPSASFSTRRESA
jgi:hypothetical protein